MHSKEINLVRGMFQGQNIYIRQALTLKSYPISQYIYALTDPETKQVRYIGRTKELAGRYIGHLASSKGKKRTPVNEWIRELAKQNLLPNLEILEVYTFSRNEFRRREYYWIRHCRTQGYNLLNCRPEI